MFDRLRSLRQVGVLPFVATADGLEVLLITTRRRQRWALPKGWPKYRKSMPEMAAREAAEEAGIVGPVHKSPIGSYRYRKLMSAGYEVTCQVFIYPMLVTEQRLDWEERNQRMTRWCLLAEASSLIEEPKLAKLMARLAAADGADLHAVMADAISRGAA